MYSQFALQTLQLAGHSDTAIKKNIYIILRGNIWEVITMKIESVDGRRN